MKSSLLSKDGANIQFVERGGIIYVIHPFAVEQQITNLFKLMDNIYTTDCITVLLDYTDDEEQTRLRQIEKQITHFKALVI